MSVFVSNLIQATAAPVAGAPTPTTSWQWKRSGTDISGATASSYTATVDDTGHDISVVQTAINMLGTASATSTALGPVLPFTPSVLFSGGTPGAWYDPSDLTTLFQDSAGTTPVTAVEQPVGLMLDKSQGLVLGVELLNNGDFSQGATGWTLGASAAITGGALVITSAPQFEYVATSSPSIGTAGKFYSYTFTISNYSAGSIGVYFYNNTGHVFSANGTYTVIVQKTDVGGIRLRSQSSTAFTGTIDNISVKELAGNHAFQSTSASRPVLSARYNLLTKTEQFDDAVWLLASGLKAFGSGSVANTTETTDPLGGNTADKLVEISGAITSAGLGLAASGVPASSGIQYTATVYAKAAGRRYAALFANGVPSGAGAYFDLQDGVVTAIGANNVSRSIVSAGNGWWKLSITFLTTTNLANFSFNLSENGTSNTYTGNGTSGIYIWGASLVPANQSTLPYQRVNTATDYATTGFLPYLKFDGVDDSLSTNSISFTATDKMSVFAGVRKLSDANTGMFLELSVNGDANAGTFQFDSPDGTNGRNVAFYSKGTVNSGANSGATQIAPITSVLTGLGDISGDLATLRINGAQVAQSTGNQGTGNYGNYPLYIGRRGGTTLPFNGQIYSMIIVGKAVTAGELSSTEAYVNQKTGAYA